MSSLLRRVLQPLRGKGLFRLPGLRTIAGFVRKRLTPNSVNIRGRRLHLNPADDHLGPYVSVYGVYEPLETEWVEGVLRPGDTAVDVGAHVGYFTLVMSTLVGPSGRVFALEASQENFQYLKRNAEELGNVEAIQMAAWSSRTLLPFYVSADNTGDHSLLRSDARQPAFEVEAAPLDDLIPADVRPDLVKIDVQGAEAEVLRGMDRILKSPPRALMIELTPHEVKETGADPELLFNRLLGLGYRIRIVNDDDRVDIDGASYQDVADYCREPWNFVNLLCLRQPSEK